LNKRILILQSFDHKTKILNIFLLRDKFIVTIEMWMEIKWRDCTCVVSERLLLDIIIINKT